MVPIIGVFIPIITVIVVALVIIMWNYFRSRERQMIIERGLDAEFVKALMTKQKHPYLLLKIGIVILFFGLGLGIGLLIEVYTGVEEWIPFLIFVGTGLGFIIAYIAGRKFEEKDKANNADNGSY